MCECGAGIFLFPGKMLKFPEGYSNFQNGTRISRTIPEYPELVPEYPKNYPNFQDSTLISRTTFHFQKNNPNFQNSEDPICPRGSAPTYVPAPRPAPTGPDLPRPDPDPDLAAAPPPPGRSATLQNIQKSVPKYPETHTRISRNPYPNFQKHIPEFPETYTRISRNNTQISRTCTQISRIHTLISKNACSNIHKWWRHGLFLPQNIKTRASSSTTRA